MKFVVTEGASYWVADMKWKWDQYLGGGHTTKKMAALMKGILSKLPSEYFGENIFVGASTMSKEEIRRRHSIGCDVAMWGTDYPHPEGTWPNTVPRLRSDFGDVPVGDTRKMLGETAARCYGFDIESLRPIAAKIGPLMVTGALRISMTWLPPLCDSVVLLKLTSGSVAMSSFASSLSV